MSDAKFMTFVPGDQVTLTEQVIQADPVLARLLSVLATSFPKRGFTLTRIVTLGDSRVETRVTCPPQEDAA